MSETSTALCVASPELAPRTPSGSHRSAGGRVHGVLAGPPPAEQDGGPPAPLGWPHVVVGQARDRPLARFVVGASGLVLGASTGMFVGGMVGVILAMILLPLLPHLAVSVLTVVTLMCGSAGAVVGRRVLQRETFDELG